MTDDKHPRTAGGKPVTEETIDHLADEADTGYDTAALRRQGGRKPMGSPRRGSSPYVSILSSSRRSEPAPSPTMPTPAKSSATPSAPGCEAPESVTTFFTGSSAPSARGALRAALARHPRAPPSHREGARITKTRTPAGHATSTSSLRSAAPLTTEPPTRSLTICTPAHRHQEGWLSGRWLSPGLGRMRGRMLVQMAPITTTNRVPPRRKTAPFHASTEARKGLRGLWVRVSRGPQTCRSAAICLASATLNARPASLPDP